MVSRTEKNKDERKKIEKEERKEKNIKFFKKFIKYFLIITTLVISSSLYIYYVSTSQLIIREYSHKYEQLPDNFDGFKIIQFSDLYYNDNYSNILDEMIIKINELKPDLVLFTGGLFDKKYKLTIEKKKEMTNRLSKIYSKTSKYFVLSSYDNEEVVELLTNSGFIFLDNKEENIFYNGNVPISIIGLNKSSDYTQSKVSSPFKIIFLNDSNKIDELMNSITPNIIMSGKTLNGQIRLPYYGALLNRESYVEQYYKVNDTDIFISGGIGTNNLPIRIFNHPSINFYRLRKK